MPSLVEILVQSPDREQRFVADRKGGITIGRSPDCQVVLDESLIGQKRVRLEWVSDQELTIALAGGLADLETPARVGEGTKVSLGGATLTWRHLPREEWPTLASGTGASTAAERLSEELKQERYEFGDEVGRGGMGLVVTAMETSLQRPIALKKLQRPENKEDQERFIREARITGRLQHPSIVPVHELRTDEKGHPFYTMKLVQGLTLQEILVSLSQGNSEALRRYPLSALLTIFQKVCDAVAFAHAQSEPVIHRDLKPGNIMIGDYGEVLVMDWGAAKVLRKDEPPCVQVDVDKQVLPNEQETEDETGSDFFTLPGSVMGTPGYMAPEQARGQADVADERTDVYALGAILYSLLTLEAPVRLTAREAHSFEERRRTGENLRDVFGTHVAPIFAGKTGRSSRLHLPGRKLPESLVAVVRKAMSLYPGDRFVSVKELQADIAAYQTGFATSAEDAGAWTRARLLIARHKLLATALLTIFVILLGATFVSLAQRRVALESNQSLQAALRRASIADLETARQRFQAGAWREGVALLGRSLSFWPANRAAADYLLSAVAFGRGDREKVPLFGVFHDAMIGEVSLSPDGRYFTTALSDHTARLRDLRTGAEVGPHFHADGTFSAPVFSLDGDKILLCGSDGLALLYDLQTGQLSVPPLRHGQPDLDPRVDVAPGAFSADGQRILTGSLDHTARLWEAASGKELAVLVNPGQVKRALFSPDESRILTSFRGGGAVLWDAHSFQQIGEPMRHTDTVRNARFSLDGNKIVTPSADGTMRIWDAHTARPLSPLLHSSEYFWDVAMNPDGETFATSSSDVVLRWSLADGGSLGTPLKHGGPVTSLSFSFDGKRLLSSSQDHTLRQWDAHSGQPVGRPMRHDDIVYSADYNRDATKIVSAGADKVAYIWDAAAPTPPGEIIPLPGVTTFLEFAEGNDDTLFVATGEGQAGLWSLGKQRFITPVAQQGAAISAAIYHATTGRFATAGPDGTVHFWNATTGQELGHAKARSDTVVALAFAPDGQSLFAAYSGAVVHWSVPGGVAIGQAWQHPAPAQAIAISPSGGEIAVGCRDDFIYRWDTKTGKARLPRIQLNNGVLAVAYSPDGKSLATGGSEHAAQTWSLPSGKPQGQSFAFQGTNATVRFTDRGNALLVNGSEKNEVTYYDLKSRGSAHLPLSHPQPVTHITANASGSLVATVTNDGVARLWRIPHTTEPPPAWLPDYLRAVGGMAFSTDQRLAEVPTRERVALRQKLLAMPPDSSEWDAIMRLSFRQ